MKTERLSKSTENRQTSTLIILSSFGYELDWSASQDFIRAVDEHVNKIIFIPYLQYILIAFLQLISQLFAL